MHDQRQTTLGPTCWHGALWYEINPARLVLEKEAMEMRFPAFRMVRDKHQLAWVGTLETNRRNINYKIAIYYPDNFPELPPRVFPIEPPITDLQHQYADGSLCLFHPNDRFFEANTTAVTVLAAAAAWFFAYETWQASGKAEWIGREAGHDE